MVDFHEKMTRRLVYIIYIIWGELILILGPVCLISISAMVEMYLCHAVQDNHEPLVSVKHLNVATVTKELNLKYYISVAPCG